MRTMQASWFSQSRSTATWAIVVLLVCGGEAYAQQHQAETGAVSVGLPGTVSIGNVKARIDALEASTNLDKSVRDSALELFRAAQSQLAAAAQYEQAANAFTAAIESTPSAFEHVRTALEIPLDEQRAAALREATVRANLPELEKRLVKTQAAEAAAVGELRDLQLQGETERERPNQIRERMSVLKRRQDEIEENLKTTSAKIPVIQEANRALLAGEQRAVIAETHMLEQEHLSYDVRKKLLSSRVNLATRKLSIAQAVKAAVQELANDSRQVEAVQTQIEAGQARVEAISKHPIIARAAELNSGLSNELAEMVANRALFNGQLATTSKLSEEIDHNFRIARQRFDIAGLSGAFGRALSDVREKLPDLDRYGREVAERQPILTAIGLGQLRITESRRGLGDLEKNIDRIMEEATDTLLSEVDEIEIRDELLMLLEDRNSLLDKLDTAYSDNLRVLGKLDYDQRQLVEKARDFARFLDQRLLWVPSTTLVGVSTFEDLGPAFGYLLAPANWKAVVEAIKDKTGKVPALTAIAVLAIIMLVALRQWLYLKLLEIGRRVRYSYVDGFSVTLRALGITLLIAAIWPLILGFIGTQLQIASHVPVFVNALGSGLVEVAGVLLFFFGFRILCCKGGVALEHLRWPKYDVLLLQRNLRTVLLVIVPAVLVTAIIGAQPEKAHINSLGRLGYIVIVVALGIFLQRVLNPGSGVLANTIKERRGTWIARLRYIWYPLTVGAPLVLAMLAALGYFYSAATLTRPIYYTLWMFVAAKILHDLVVRWLVVNQARLERKKALAAIAADGGAETSGEGGPVSIPEEAALDFPTINAQTRRLLNAVIVVSLVLGVSLIWSGVVPALGILDDVVLWQHSTVLEGKETLQPITLIDMGLAALVAVLVLIVARNFPGLLEIAVLQQLPIDSGLRYAITSISQYTIVTVGIVVFFSSIGVSWSDVQWLAAALTVGLGFGLQEIFANFMSGFLLLFERPVRIGDTVSVGNITGTVSRIRLRATTITDWDNKEIVVPNKTFITSQLTNWTLSDPIVRVVIQIGIAHGSDTKLAHRLMLETVQAESMVLEEPRPSVFFMGVGESSLDFDVRVYVKNMDDYMPVTHRFNMAVVDVLSENGVVIPYPQRDIHVRSVQSVAGSEVVKHLQEVGDT
jgi:potassium efflux system protein